MPDAGKSGAGKSGDEPFIDWGSESANAAFAAGVASARSGTGTATDYVGFGEGAGADLFALLEGILEGIIRFVGGFFLAVATFALTPGRAVVRLAKPKEGMLDYRPHPYAFLAAAFYIAAVAFKGLALVFVGAMDTSRVATEAAMSFGSVSLGEFVLFVVPAVVAAAGTGLLTAVIARRTGVLDAPSSYRVAAYAFGTHLLLLLATMLWGLSIQSATIGGRASTFNSVQLILTYVVAAYFLVLPVRALYAWIALHRPRGSGFKWGLPRLLGVAAVSFAASAFILVLGFFILRASIGETSAHLTGLSVSSDSRSPVVTVDAVVHNSTDFAYVLAEEGLVTLVIGPMVPLEGADRGKADRKYLARLAVASGSGASGESGMGGAVLPAKGVARIRLTGQFPSFAPRVERIKSVSVGISSMLITGSGAASKTGWIELKDAALDDSWRSAWRGIYSNLETGAE